MNVIQVIVSELVREQMLKVKPQHGKQVNREHVLCVQCTVCIVCMMIVAMMMVYDDSGDDDGDH